MLDKARDRQHRMRRAHREPLHLGVDRVEFGGGIDASALREALQHRERDVLADAQSRHDAVTLAVLRHHADAGANRVDRRANLHAACRSSRRRPRSRPDTRRRSPASVPCGRRRPARPRRESRRAAARTTRRRRACGRGFVTSKQVTLRASKITSPIAMRLARKQVLDLAARPSCEMMRSVVELVHRLRRDMPAVADHGDRVADGCDFVELVRDVDAGHAAPLQVAHDVEQDARSRTPSATTTVRRESAASRACSAPWRSRSTADGRRRSSSPAAPTLIPLMLEFAQQFVGALVHRRVIHAAAGQRDLVAEKDVLRHRQLAAPASIPGG